MAKESRLESDADIYKKRAPKTEMQKLSEMTRKEKLTYFKDYYLLKLIALILVIGMCGSLLYNIFGPKPDTALYIRGVNFNYNHNNETIFVKNAGKALDINLEKEAIILDNGIASMGTNSSSAEIAYAAGQELVAMVMSHQIDIMICNEESFQTYLKDGYFINLSEVLPSDLYSDLSNDFYIGKSTEEETEEHPYGIRLTNSSQIQTLFGPTINSTSSNNDSTVDFSKVAKNYILGIVANSERKDNSINFLKFLYDDK